MGLNLKETYPEAASIFEQIDSFAGRSLSEMCFNGPDSELKRTINTQPTIMQTSLAAWACYQKLQGPKPDFVAGHSLGEITALVASQSLSLDHAKD